MLVTSGELLTNSVIGLSSCCYRESCIVHLLAWVCWARMIPADNLNYRKSIPSIEISIVVRAVHLRKSTLGRYKFDAGLMTPAFGLPNNLRTATNLNFQGPAAGWECRPCKRTLSHWRRRRICSSTWDPKDALGWWHRKWPLVSRCNSVDRLEGTFHEFHWPSKRPVVRWPARGHRIWKPNCRASPDRRVPQV